MGEKQILFIFHTFVTSKNIFHVLSGQDTLWDWCEMKRMKDNSLVIPKFKCYCIRVCLCVLVRGQGNVLMKITYKNGEKSERHWKILSCQRKCMWRVWKLSLYEWKLVLNHDGRWRDWLIVLKNCNNKRIRIIKEKSCKN